MSLKEITKDLHTEAEKQPFVKELFSGNIDPELYATYLFNQQIMYEVLEIHANIHGLLNDLPDIRRAALIKEDYLELWTKPEIPPVLPTTHEYIQYIVTNKDNPKKLLAHIYVRHMGDLSGGQMIATKVPGEGRCYKFADPEALKTAIRAKIDDSLGDEAKECFKFSIKFFKELMEHHDSTLE
jgi:heme oxygenase